MKASSAMFVLVDHLGFNKGTDNVASVYIRT